MNELIKWDNIRTQIELAKDIETLTELKDKLRAYQILAEQSKQSQEVQAKIAIYKARADRKCGEWLKNNIEHGGQNKKARLQDATSLKDLKLNKSESSRLQKIADIPEDKFESILLEAEVETKKITNNMLVNIAKEAENKEYRNNIKSVELPKGKFNVIYADPAWEYRNSGFEMSAEKKYPTMSTENICNLPIKELSAENCVLLLWITNPLLIDGIKVIESWGFEYKTNFVWTKTRHTAGFYNFGQHELLIIAVKGSMLPKEKFKSIIEGSNNIHSKKPEIVYEIIEKMYPNGKYLELFARNIRKKWNSWGNEI